MTIKWKKCTTFAAQTFIHHFFYIYHELFIKIVWKENS